MYPKEEFSRWSGRGCRQEARCAATRGAAEEKASSEAGEKTDWLGREIEGQRWECASEGSALKTS